MDWQKFGNLRIVEGKGGEKLDGNGKIINKYCISSENKAYQKHDVSLRDPKEISLCRRRRICTDK